MDDFINNEEVKMKFKIGAPSKVLITGGYLILSPENEGLVLSLDCYFWIEVNAIWTVSQNPFESKT